MKQVCRTSVWGARVCVCACARAFRGSSVIFKTGVTKEFERQLESPVACCPESLLALP